MGKKAVVLSSGGVDSTTALSVAVDRYGAENVSTLSMIYGQKHTRELEAARKVANYYEVNHYELDLSEIFKYNTTCTLLKNSNEDVPEGTYAEQQKGSEGKAVSTYVPFRNGLMISSAVSFAMSIYPDDEIEIFLGNHSDDSAGNAYPDCSELFSTCMNDAIYEGSGHLVSLRCPFVDCNKSEVVKIGLQLKAPYEFTYSCYNGEEIPCRKCATCIDREKAFKDNGWVDPLLVALGLEEG